MQSTIKSDTVELTCTFEDLVTMDSLDLAIYATPSPHGEVAQVYLASRPQWADDFLLATTQDFDEEEGYDITGGSQEMDDEAMAHVNGETYTITKPRIRELPEED